MLNVIPGTGDAGDTLVRHPRIDKISFTRGLETACKVGATAGQTINPVVLELGGKSANIVFADAASTRAVDGDAGDGRPASPDDELRPHGYRGALRACTALIERAKANQDGELFTGGGAVDRDVLGPAMAAMRFSEEEVVKLTNDSQYQWWSYLFPLKKR